MVAEDLRVHVDYKADPIEAVRDVGGMGERAKLVEGDGDFAECTWMDGTKWQSRVANLMLSVKRAPLRVGSKFAKKPVVKKKPAAAKKLAKKPVVKKKPAKKPAKPEDDDEEEEEEEEEEQECDEEQEQEDEEEGEEEDAVDDEAGDEEDSAPVPAKKAKTGEPQELQPTCPYTCKAYINNT